MGAPAGEALARRLEATEVAVKNQDNREHDIFDSDDYLQDHGGLVAAIRSLRGGVAPEAVFGDSSDPGRARVRSLAEEAARVVRTRVLNPKWLSAMQRHGYKGAFEMAATVDYLFGYDATAHVVEDWMYERVTAAYVTDPSMRKFFERSNPWALRSVAERLLEAAERGCGTLLRVPSPRCVKPCSRARGGRRTDERRDADECGDRTGPWIPVRGRRRHGGGQAGSPHRRRRAPPRRHPAPGPEGLGKDDACPRTGRALPGEPGRRLSTCRSARPRIGSSARSTSRWRCATASGASTRGCWRAQIVASSTWTRSICCPTTSSTSSWTWRPPARTGWSETG